MQPSTAARHSKNRVEKSLPGILLIEDSPSDSLLLSRTIERNGAGRVTVSKNGIDGLKLCLAERPDLLLLDLELPGLRGEEICRILRSSQAHQTLPIIIISALPDAKKRELEMLGLGANAYLEKPFLEAELLASVADQLRRTKAGARPAAATDQSKFAPATPADRAAPSAFQRPDAILSTNFHGYRIEGILGSGGMGTVYKAVQLSLDRQVAIKVLLKDLEDDNESRDRFRREAKIMARINHPNVVQIYNIGFTDYTAYLVMEYVEGWSLWHLIQADCMSRPGKLAMADQICRAISHLHDKGILHRDLKPTNILVDKNGIPKVTDFGVSWTDLGHTGTDRRELELAMGTPQYMAPELLEGAPSHNGSDQFSLGLTLWLLFAGPGQAVPAIQPLHLVRPSISREVSDVIARFYDPEAAHRHASIDAGRLALLHAFAKGSDPLGA